ncbi:MAG: acyltransferase [Sphingomonas sp.]|nr:acyltransferase [Sphingomonas sp.]
MQRENFLLVQALRGLAALWVVLFHLEKQQAIAGLTVHLPSWLTYSIFGYGSAGVAVFFVLSGFVIAHSLAGKDMTVRELGRFALRRSARLDPPYWASMALVVATGAALALAHHEPPQLPGAGQVAAHVLYVQEFLRIPELQVVYWTLTYEIQFYLVFAASALLDRRWQWGLYALALISAFAGREWGPHGLFVNLWHGFFLGVLAYRCGYLKEASWPLWVLAAVALLFRHPEAGVFAVPCAATAGLLFVAARAERLTTALSARPWQWLGAISYSLYLVHVPTLRLLTGAWQRVADRGPIADAIGGMLLLGACIAAAALFYLAFERPSHRLAKRLFRLRPGHEVSSGQHYSEGSVANAKT